MPRYRVVIFIHAEDPVSCSEKIGNCLPGVEISRMDEAGDQAAATEPDQPGAPATEETQAEDTAGEAAEDPADEPKPTPI